MEQRGKKDNEIVSRVLKLEFLFFGKNEHFYFLEAEIMGYCYFFETEQTSIVLVLNQTLWKSHKNSWNHF